MRIYERRDYEKIDVARLNIVLENGDRFIIFEDIEGHLNVSKQSSDNDEKISVFPRYSNEVTIK